MPKQIKQTQFHYDAGSNPPWSFVIIDKKDKTRCRVKWCRRDRRVEWRKGRSNPTTHKTCTTCHSRLWRANNPAKDAYFHIKDRARQRGQIFRLTFAEFLKEIEGSDYLQLRGKHSLNLHIDREDRAKGYVPGNLKIITAAQNVTKRNKHERNPLDPDWS